MRKSDSRKQNVEIFWKNVYYLHGFPKVIVTDRDAKFNDNFLKKIFKHIRTYLNMSSAYHSQTDGQTKVANKCLKTYLRCYATNKQNKWVQWLHLAE